MKLSLSGDYLEYYEGILHLSEMGFFQLCDDTDSYKVVVSSCEEGLSICGENHKIQLKCNRKIYFFRALGLILEKIQNDEKTYTIAEKPGFDGNGLLLDCSCNAVANVKTIKELICMMALMGLNTLQLYTKDTYEIPDHPYFGYLRGRYTKEELKSMDAYADEFGIEMIPCIQTLAHMDTVLRWDCYVNKIRDCEDILLCDEQETYRLIEEMIRQMAVCFKSRKINIGMNHAQMMGLGKYINNNGYHEPEQIFFRHLNRVADICKKYGFSPVIWGDMVYKFIHNGQLNAKITDEIVGRVIDLLPSNVALACSEYSAVDPKQFRCKIKDAIKISNNTIFVGGAWKWIGPAPALKFSLDEAKKVLPICLESAIKDVFVAAWGDNGNECAMFTILPVLQMYAEISYAGKIPTNEELSSRLSACTHASLDDFLLLDLPNKTTTTIKEQCNPSKYLLYQDVASGLFDLHVDENFSNLYRKYASELKNASERNERWAYLFQTLSDLCSVLEIKSVLGCRMRAAYKKHNADASRRITETEIPELIQRLYILLNSWRFQWNQENKVQGFETINIRIGGIIARLKTLQYRLLEFIDGQVNSLPELHDELLYFDGRAVDDTADINTSCNIWHLIATTNMMAF